MATVTLFTSNIKDWLPVVAYRQRKSEYLKPLSTLLPKRWSRISWLIGVTLTFGMPIISYFIKLYFNQAFSI
jgi:hypothetical protein